MNLYGDLPPAADGSTNTVQPTGSWSGLAVAAKPKPSPAVSVVSRPVNEAKPPVKISVPSSPKLEEEVAQAVPKFVPAKVSAALAFKPRQALQPSSLTARPTAPIANSSQTAQLQVPQQQRTTTIVKVSKFSPPLQTETRKEEQSEAGNENESFVNEVAAFDVDDPYDPSKPNDYVKLLDEREEAIQFQLLQRENQLVLEESERIREENAKQRLLAVQSGDYSSLLASSINNRGSGISSISAAEVSSESAVSSSGSRTAVKSADQPMGRGRGRGLVNLPAWMTQKMEADAAAAAATATAALGDSNHSSSVAPIAATTQQSNSGQFEDADKAESKPATAVSTTTPSINMSSIIGMKRKQSNFSKPSSIVLLKNMVSFSEVDGSLAEETKQECSKFGAVRRCVVHTVPEKEMLGGKPCPEEERVRVFVVFETQESAVKAYRDMNGRFFGGRKITVSFYDEDKFDRSDLAPVSGEW